MILATTKLVSAEPTYQLQASSTTACRPANAELPGKWYLQNKNTFGNIGKNAALPFSVGQCFLVYGGRITGGITMKLVIN